MSAAATLAPASPIARAVARPIPAPAPVTNTTLSSRIGMSVLPHMRSRARDNRVGAAIVAKPLRQREDFNARQYPRYPDRRRDKGARRAGSAGPGDPPGSGAEIWRSLDPDRRRRG